MSRRNQSKPAPPVDETKATDPTPAATEEVVALDEESSADEPAPPVHDGDTVPALVLYNSVYGRCGEVKRFPAETAQAIAAAGFIDTHPNAVASVEH